jgi:hypothetical protein
MQDHLVIGTVVGVAMRIPIRCAEVYFDIADRLHAIIEAQPRAAKIRPAEQIPFAGLHHANPAATGRHRRSAVEISPQPYLLQKFFGKRKRAIESLNLGDSWRACSHGMGDAIFRACCARQSSALFIHRERSAEGSPATPENRSGRLWQMLPFSALLGAGRPGCIPRGI